MGKWRSISSLGAFFGHLFTVTMPKMCNNSSAWFQLQCLNNKKTKPTPDVDAESLTVQQKTMCGTPKDLMKQLCPPKAKLKVKPAPASNPEKVKSLHENDSVKP